jgi:hypothetical protein
MNLTLEIESLGLSEESVIISVEANIYDERWNRIKSDYWNCDILGQMLDRSIERNSLDVWKDKKEAFTSKLHLAVSLEECLRELHQFISAIEGSFNAWSTCPLVDLKILKHAGSQSGVTFDIPQPHQLKGRNLFNTKDRF